MESLEYLVKLLPDNLRLCCNKVLNSPEFNIWPASLDKHQSYPGGLLQHTKEVANICLDTAKNTKANRDILIVSAIYHDYGKIYDYSIVNHSLFNLIKNNIININNINGIWGKAPDRFLARHPVRSYHEWMVEAEKNNISEDIKLDISHCILAHHGRLEWNSPVEPQTIEAAILHHSDVISGRFL